MTAITSLLMPQLMSIKENAINDDPVKLTNNLKSLHKTIEELQLLVNEAATIANYVNSVLKVKQIVHKSTGIDVLPNKDKVNLVIDQILESKDITLDDSLMTKRINKNRYQRVLSEYKAEPKKQANTDVKVKIVKSINDIPISFLYYISDENRYAINVNGMILTGNLGKLLRPDLRTFEQYTNIRSCSNGSLCTNTKCNFYHKRANEVKNFTIGSWIYSNQHTKYYTRKVGGSNTIVKDLSNMTHNELILEKESRHDQLMHDLLIYMVLCKM